MRKFKKVSLFTVVFVSLLIGLLAGATLNLDLNTFAESESDYSEDDYNEQIASLQTTDFRNIFADIAEDAQPSIVKVTSMIERDVQHRFPFDDPFFQEFFRHRFPFEEETPEYREGYGSGFIVSEDGYIVTNEHVIHGAEEENIKVHLIGFEDPLSAEVSWADPELDLAILKVDVEEELPALPLGDSDNIRPGDWAIAIGNPLEFEHTVTTGVISALERPIDIPTEDGIRHYPNLIQTDAAINPGNSGGPLLNIDGEAVGINTAVSMQGQGIGFAIPINEVKNYVDELKETGEIIRPYLGVYYQPVTEPLARQLNLPDTDGALIREVIPDSPADKAGLQVYDVIVEINKQSIDEANQLPELINQLEIGEEIMIRIVRNGQNQILSTTIEKRP